MTTGTVLGGGVVRKLSVIRRYIRRALGDFSGNDGTMSFLNKCIFAVIAVSLISAVIETEPTLQNALPFIWLNVGFALFFSAEFVIRLWAFTGRYHIDGAIKRLPPDVRGILALDLVVVSFWVGSVSEIFLLRFLRLVLLIRLMEVPVIAAALRDLAAAVYSRRGELAVSLIFAAIIMFVAAVALYLIEGRIQPDAFGSIPRALWWGVATLTTVGYGDVFPVTALGKCAAAIFALAGIGVVALPAGIFASALVDRLGKTSAP